MSTSQNPQFELAVISAARNVLNGYSRETCIKFLTAEGYGPDFAAQAVDQAIDRISENYG